MAEGRDAVFENNGGGQPQGNQAHEEEQTQSHRTAKILDKSEAVLMKMAQTLEIMNKSLQKRQAEEPVGENLDPKCKRAKPDEAQAGPSREKSPALPGSQSDSETDLLSSEDEEEIQPLDIDDILDNEDDGGSEDDLANELDSFFEEQSETGEKLNSEKIAKAANRSLSCPVEEDKIKEIRKKYKRPENVEFMQTPQVDHFIWRQLSRDVRNVDVQLQKATGQMVQGLIPILKAVDHINDNKTLDKGVLKPLIVDAFKMMAHSVASNSKTRRERIRNAVLPKFRNMIQKSKPSATLLLGDKIKEEVKALNEKSTAVTQSAGSKQAFLQKRGGAAQYNRQRSIPYKNSSGKPRKWQQDHHKKQQGGKTFRK